MANEATTERKLERVTPEDLPVVYTNSVELKLSPFDVVLLVGRVEEATKEHLVIRELVKVIMSPQHFKVLASVLSQNLAEYERQFGAIPEAKPKKGPEN